MLLAGLIMLIGGFSLNGTLTLDSPALPYTPSLHAMQLLINDLGICRSDHTNQSYHVSR